MQANHIQKFLDQLDCYWTQMRKNQIFYEKRSIGQFLKY